MGGEKKHGHRYKLIKNFTNTNFFFLSNIKLQRDFKEKEEEEERSVVDTRNSLI